MKHSRELAYIRQLCCLGLPKESVVREFLCTVPKVISTSNNIYIFIDSKELKPAGCILPGADLKMAEITQSLLFNYLIHERMGKIAAWFQHSPVLTDYRVFDTNIFNSEVFNLVAIPMDQYQPLMASITDKGKPVGIISLFRSRLQKPFTKEDQALFLCLIPYFKHAL